MTQYGVRIPGRGVVTRFNDQPITERETAEQIVRSIDLMYGEEGTIEKIVLDLPVPSQGQSSQPKERNDAND